MANLQSYSNMFKLVKTLFFTYHSHVDIASVELHVDLLVNHSLGVGVKVNPDTGSHFCFLDNLEVFS